MPRTCALYCILCCTWRARLGQIGQTNGMVSCVRVRDVRLVKKGSLFILSHSKYLQSLITTYSVYVWTHMNSHVGSLIRLRKPSSRRVSQIAWLCSETVPYCGSGEPERPLQFGPWQEDREVLSQKKKWTWGISSRAASSFDFGTPPAQNVGCLSCQVLEDFSACFVNSTSLVYRGSNAHERTEQSRGSKIRLSIPIIKMKINLLWGW